MAAMPRIKELFNPSHESRFLSIFKRNKKKAFKEQEENSLNR